MKKKMIWFGVPPKECDICHKPIADTFVDANTTLGAWGNICPSCFKLYGIGLGTGKGQEYKKTGNEWVKTERSYDKKLKDVS